MKIIELLNKIANGEEVPKEIIYNGYNYIYHTDRKSYYRSVVGSNWIALTTDFSICTILNDEVEILEEEPRDIEVCGTWITKSEYDKLAHNEEEKKIPEKLGECAYVNGEIAYGWSDSETVLKNKINEIIDCLDYLKSKGE